MKFESLDRIYEHKQDVHRALRQRTLPLSPAQQTFRPSPGQWTIQEALEHLSIVDASILKLIGALLQKAKESGGGALNGVIEIPEGVENSSSGKIRTRPQSVPTGNVAIGQSLAGIGDVDGQLITLRPRLERVDLSSVSFPHWIFGQFTLGQWLAFIGVHEQRHLGQMEAVMEAEGFPG